MHDYAHQKLPPLPYAPKGADGLTGGVSYEKKLIISMIIPGEKEIKKFRFGVRGRITK